MPKPALAIPSIRPVPGLKTAWLACIVTLQAYPELSKASQQLGLSPQGFRRNLKALEQYLNMSLFSIKKGLGQLTPTGEYLAREAKQILFDLNYLDQLHIKPTPNKLVIGWNHIALKSELQRFCEYLFSQEQLLDIQIRKQTYHKSLLNPLMQENFDIIFTDRAYLTPKIQTCYGKPVPYQIFSAPQEMRPWQELCYAIPDGEIAYLNKWPENDSQADIMIRSSCIEVLIDLAKSGLCAIYLPESMVDKELQNGSLIPVAVPPHNHFFQSYLCWKEDKFPAELNQLLCAFGPEPDET